MKEADEHPAPPRSMRSSDYWANREFDRRLSSLTAVALKQVAEDPSDLGAAGLEKGNEILQRPDDPSTAAAGQR